MRLVTIVVDKNEIPGVLTDDGFIRIDHLIPEFDGSMLDLIKSQTISEIKSQIKNGVNNFQIIPIEDVTFAPLYKNPNKIMCIGLNYQEHASDLDTSSPNTIPVVFFKYDNVIVGQGDTIKIPKMSNKTTGEAELGIIIGRECRNIKEEDWMDYIVGFTPILDITAEDILRQNPRYLTMSKCFDTFLSFGPVLYTTDEIADVSSLKVSTVLNNKVVASNSVSNMMFSPAFIVSFLSSLFTLNPGDIISTGTPGAVHLQHEDILECRIEGFKSLTNEIKDLKI
jgi:2-keto-4-pentenoate hydratase/2-oxohepta-3-ene-1,7-dioic acid hydratase in catechol pathway